MCKGVFNLLDWNEAVTFRFTNSEDNLLLSKGI